MLSFALRGEYVTAVRLRVTATRCRTGCSATFISAINFLLILSLPGLIFKREKKPPVFMSAPQMEAFASLPLLSEILIASETGSESAANERNSN